MVRRRRGSNKKRSRDQNAPKKVKSAWQMFLSDNREEVKKQHSDWSNSEILKKLGEMWRHCDDTTKTRYHKQYQMSQAEYDQKMAVYREEKSKKSQSSKSKKHSSGQSKQENRNDEKIEFNDSM